jgi:LysR family glycine cleavage system transcriptional activator
LTTLRAFEATARLEGYSAASRSLNVTPAAIAQQVRKLEKDLGVKLVRRDGRGLALTEDGRDLALTLHDAFDLISEGVGRLQQRDATRGVRVSTTDYFVNVVVLPELGNLWQRHPTLQVSFSPDGNTQPLDFEAFDVFVRGGAPDQVWPGCTATRLLETPIIVCAAPSLLQSRGSDLSTLPWIRDRGMGGTVFEEVIQQVGCDPEQLTYVDPGSSKLELDAAVMGYGVHSSPEMTVHKELQEGHLVRLDVPVRAPAVYYALYRTGPVSEPVKDLIDWLVEVSAPFSCEVGGM